MTTSSNKNTAIRRPLFMGESAGSSRAEPVAFAPVGGASARRIARPFEMTEAAPLALHPAPVPISQPNAAPVMEAAGPNHRLEAAIEALRLRSERLAEEARSDALEIGFMVARRILEQELTVSPAPLFSLIRSAIRRAGESRKLTLRLSPSDLTHLEAARESGAAGSLSLATIELVPDPSLGAGDCVVEGDLGMVDGRLAARLAELARTLETSGGGGPA